jgi:hypothetical protein
MKNKLKMFLARRLFAWAYNIAPIVNPDGYKLKISVLQFFTDQNNFVNDGEINDAANEYEKKASWGECDNSYSKEDFVAGVNWLISKLVTEVND